MDKELKKIKEFISDTFGVQLKRMEDLSWHQLLYMGAVLTFKQDFPEDYVKHRIYWQLLSTYFLEPFFWKFTLLDLKTRFARVRAARGWSPAQGWLLVPQWLEPTPWTGSQMPPGPKTSVTIRLF